MWQSITHYLLLALESVVGVFGLRLYEEPRYTVLDGVNERIEIRHYAPRRAAEVALPSDDKKARDDAFRTLFDYISGANRSASGSDLIAMTVPVAVDDPELVAMTVPVQTGEQDGMMRFFLPAKYNETTPPDPLNTRVRLLTIPAQTIAALRYSGSGRNAGAKELELIEGLEGSAWQPVGPPYTLYYDAPFSLPFVRRNEAAVMVIKAP
jgi:SOUL heme-binding protein